jgi:hypothetical protein
MKIRVNKHIGSHIFSSFYDNLVTMDSNVTGALTGDENLIGANIIPFAVLFSGNFVCLDFRNSKDPSVVVWFHEESNGFKSVTKKVAESLLNLLIC